MDNQPNASELYMMVGRLYHSNVSYDSAVSSLREENDALKKEKEALLKQTEDQALTIQKLRSELGEPQQALPASV